MKAIETHYAGCRFRSRLEARWAVFFDALGIKWRYEPEGYLIGDPYGPDTPYLPDFQLPELNVWVEVKGAEAALDRYLLVRAVDEWSGGPLPGMSNTALSGSNGGLLVLGDLPPWKPLRGHPQARPGHTLLTHRKGVYHGTLVFLGDGGTDKHAQSSDLPGCTLDVTTGSALCRPPADGTCSWLERPRVGTDHPAVRTHEVELLWNAYTKARSARFEHGERG